MVKDMVPFLSEEFTKRNNKFRLELTGVSHKKQRKELCFKYTDEILGPLVGALFIRYAFCLADKQEVEEMMKLIVEEFITNIDKDVEWISEHTKKAIEKKVNFYDLFTSSVLHMEHLDIEWYAKPSNVHSRLNFFI